jgi:hypothetical protein
MPRKREIKNNLESHLPAVHIFLNGCANGSSLKKVQHLAKSVGTSMRRSQLAFISG